MKAVTFRFLYSFCVALGVFVFVSAAVLTHASIGVGVGTGKIKLDQPIGPGTIYTLPPLNVINTGDEASEYKTDVAYHEAQPQLRPPQEWIHFDPPTFYLEPKEIKPVQMTLDLPVNAEPGDYFAYLEVQPVVKEEKGAARIGVAAATKLNFTVKPANIFMGVYYKLQSLWKQYAPWPMVGSIVFAAALCLAVLRRFVHIQLSVKPVERKK